MVVGENGSKNLDSEFCTSFCTSTRHPGQIFRFAGMLVRHRYSLLAGSFGISEVFQVYRGGKTYPGHRATRK